jgi:hypothetical protein
MAATNPYQLTASDQAEISNWATRNALDPTAKLAEANRLLISGEAASMDDLRRLAEQKTASLNAAKTAPLDVPMPSPIPNAPIPLASYQPPSFGPVATAPTTTATVAGYTPSAYSPTSYSAPTQKAAGYDPSMRDYRTYDASQVEDQTMLEVTPEQTVESRLQGLLSKGSPLLTLAQTRARQGMNQRGLLSSSMAEGEALRAMTEAALPIASADAATFANAARFNAEMANVLAQFNVTQINAAEAFNADAANQALSDNQRITNSAAEFLANAKNVAAANNTAALNRAAEFSANAANQASAAAALARNNADAFLAQAQNAASSQAAGDANAAARQATADANRLNELTNQARLDAAKYISDALNRAQENERRIKADMELQDFNRRAQVSESAISLYREGVTAITRIMENPDLEPGAKQAAVDQQKAAINTGLVFIEQVNKIDGLTELLRG